MSKLERKNHKVFGINATETKVGQFGSANATTKITTKDVEKIQALDAWEQGWEAGAVGNNRYPTQQERTGVDYEHSYQIGYMLQEGIPEWNKDTTYNKGSIVKAYNGTTLQNYVSLVDDNLNNAVTDITKWKSGLANSDLSNLTTTGEKHFLNKSQITNCLLEVPQRIKYTLVDGVLTILKGSICIVPYGTKDKTADLPKGATFINENFKVYDTQYTEDSDGKGKFFVWAELQKDLSIITLTTITITGFLIGLSDNEGHGHWSGANFSSGSSFPSSPQNTDVFYHVTNNRVYFYNQSRWITTDLGGNDCLILPQINFTGANKQIVSVNQVFNGMGYIGSTVWVDKGVKGLVSNGRNTDGSFVNEEVTTDILAMQTISNFTEPNAKLAYLPVKLWDSYLDYVPQNIIYEQNAKPQITDSNYRWYDTINNKWYVFDINENIGQYAQFLELADMSYTNGKITSFTPKFPFRAVDENDIDGMLKMVNHRLLNGYSLDINTTIKADLSSVLPNDGEIYECRFVYQTATGYNQTAFIYQQTDIELQSSAMWRGRSFSTGASMQGGGTFITYVGGQRYINLLSTSASSGACNIVLDLRSYRKVGK